ncbi:MULTISPECIES: acyl-CoA dehydrogenase family protein [unclassified Marinobacter]|uniref:acyl-CoA dehydrogenase family protein n=1 Tax=unclassified Marinobacter TaxID=83889 RepID=UPI00200E59E6|nr:MULTISPECIES: acyl-CoA dehydrogenase family protein [unclassified Marinobacter]MCL1483124.1 acyl-CoA dehydrogenase family protein [Marinobacter sp.]UQG54557.1 acyl-CoA dehydrogenase family protein [Marinobacter sp. M4C]UQG63362.1 acyl-CoA dehydrogenase family protein [Marinobacter sp. M2C]UQG67642.1 acyl-CoA dehydrogenase family protein [Marinobacter sp. M1C]
MTAIVDQEELALFRESVIKALEKEIKPHYEQWEKDGIAPRKLWNTLGDAGMLCVDVPEDCGGCGAPFQYSVVVSEELARMGFGALSTNVMVHSDIVAPYLSHLGNDEQKQQWLPKMVSGETVGAIAMTEPGAGSDLQAMRTSAVKEGDDYILNGSKTFITNGQHADMVIVAAKTDPSAGAKGVSLFLVDTTLEGYGVGRNLDKIGQHAGDTSELFFADMRVPASALLGEAGKGFAYLMQELPRERLVIGALGVAAARGALDLTVAYCQERVLFGQKLAQLQNTRFEMARMETEYRINKAFVDQCINEYVAGTLNAATASMAKYSATEMQCRVTDGCLQLFGGYGYTSEYPISRAFADARVQRIYGGTSEIMKEIIARSIFGRA